MTKEHSGILNRMFVIFGLVLLVPCAIGIQIFRINFVEGPELRQLWNEQAIDYISIPAQRGNIYDSDGSLLATNSVAYKVAIDPQITGLTQSEIHQVCDTLGKYGQISSQGYLQKINSASQRSRYVVLDKNVRAQAYEALRQMDIRGVILEENYERRYSFNSLAAHVLGFANYEMTGVTGLEKEYNEELHGEDGVQQVRRERNGRIYAYVGAPRKQPQQGHSLYTTIDSHIQAIVEEELKAGIERTSSVYGSAIVMDPKTGAIKAMANYPTYDPNDPSTLDSNNRRNFAISDMIEPGSTFKLVTAIAAVEQQKVNFSETFETPENGRTRIHGQWMRDHDPLGTLSFPEVIEQSSNVATSEIAMRLDQDTFYQYARNLGFGTLTNVDLPSEEMGRLPKPYEWSKVTLPWMSIGYEVQVTPLQIAQAYAAFANKGEMMRPYIVDKVVNSEGGTEWQQDQVEVRQIAKEETINKLYPVFQRVVSDSGTADLAQVQGLSIAGKTGTAQKLVNGRYTNSYRSSFVGFFPADDPKYVALIILDNPDTYPPYGGHTAGPIFQQTANRIAGLDNDIEKQILDQDIDTETWAMAPNLTGLTKRKATTLLNKQDIPFDIEGSGDWITGQTPNAGMGITPTDKITLQLSNQTAEVDTTELPDGYSIIPDVGGMSMRNASRLIASRGYDVKRIGSGTVYTQFPRPGDQMQKGSTITIRGKAKSLNNIVSK